MMTYVTEFSTPPETGFEGPEKKLEVSFSTTRHGEQGLRHYPNSVWQGVLNPVQCTILQNQSNRHFDAYMLSESSLFIYPQKIVLKTCGTTTLLLVLPELLKLAVDAACNVELVHYGHFRYKFPHEQKYPHSSFSEEVHYLTKYFPHGDALVLGPQNGRCWHLYVADYTNHPLPTSPTCSTPLPLPFVAATGSVFEVVMEDLAPAVCAQFFNSDNAPTARQLTQLSGIGGLMPNAVTDEFFFSPCGYSLNALEDGYYYTIHITPEEGFSYASFETNIPIGKRGGLLEKVLDVFRPTHFSVIETAESNSNQDPFHLSATTSMRGYECSSWTTGSALGASLVVYYASYSTSTKDGGCKSELDTVAGSQKLVAASVAASGELCF